MRLTLSELAQLVGGDITRGEPDAAFDGISALDEAGPSEISFLGNEKYKSQFLATSAGSFWFRGGSWERLNLLR